MSAECEICGGSNIKKEISGDFVCQDCGATYSVDAMRLMITGEIIDETPDTPSEPEPGEETVEERLEKEVKENFDLGNFSRAYALLNDYVLQKRQELGEDEDIPFELIPYADFLGNLGRQLDDIDSGKSRTLAISMRMRAFVDRIIKSGHSGSDCIAAISELYIIVSKECLKRSNHYIDLAMKSKNAFDRTSNLADFEKGLEEKAVAENLFDAQRRTREEAILGCEYVSALGMELNEAALNYISLFMDKLDTILLSLPHINGAVGYLSDIVSPSSTSQRRVIPEDTEDAIALTSCGKRQWLKSDYGLAGRVFALALKADKTPEAKLFYSAFGHLNHVAHTWVLADDYIDNIVNDFSETIEALGNAGQDDAIADVAADADLVCRALKDYARAVRQISTAQQINDYPNYEKTKMTSDLLLKAIPRICSKAFDYAERRLEAGQELTKEHYASIKRLAEKYDYETHDAFKALKNSYIETQVNRDDYEANKKSADKAKELVDQARFTVRKLEEERANLGLFEMARKKQLDQEIVSARQNLDQQELAYKDAQSSLDKIESKREAAWEALRQTLPMHKCDR